MTHPYDSLPNRSFWSRSVANGFDASDIVKAIDPLLRRDDRVMSAGSCFAANLVPYLEKAGFSYVRTERQHVAFAKLPSEALGYDNFSARYGNIYTARQMLQLIQRTKHQFKPHEDRWIFSDAIIDPFRPGLRYPARSNPEFDALTAQHLAAVRSAISQATVLIFTLGLTEAWMSRDDGAVFPACPGTVGGTFDPARHVFVNFSVAEVAADLGALIEALRSINPDLAIILTVSPVPLVATASGQHVLAATTYSKAVLRVAAEEMTRAYEAVTYFPAYEIVTGPQAPADFFAADKRNVSKAGVDLVMAAFLKRCEAPDGTARVTVEASPDLRGLSRAIVEAECEEAMSDQVRAKSC